MTEITKRRKHRGGRRHAKLKQRRQAEHEARLQQAAAVGGGGGGPAVQPETALFERPQETESDFRLARRAVNHRWATDPKLGERILEKLSRQALGEETVPPFTPMQLIVTTRLHLDVQRLKQADEHHADRLDLAERALQVRLETGRYRPGSTVSVETTGQSKVQIYLPENDPEPSEVDPVDEP